MILITGSACRIGKALALQFAECGWHVIIHYHTSQKEAEALIEEINHKADFDCALALQANLSNDAEVHNFFESAWAWKGKIDCLVNNASLFQKDSWKTATFESLQAHFSVNLQAPFLLTQLFSNAYEKEFPEKIGDKNVINIVDYQMLRQDDPPLNPEAFLSFPFFSYALSKASLWELTQKLALALVPHIRVNAIALGYVLPPETMNQKAWEKRVSETPLQRETSVNEIFEALQFILKAPSLTGQLILLDSGQHLRSRMF